MLVLTRRFGEALRLGDNIVVRVIGLNEGRIRVAIEAPPEVKILRGELIGPDQGPASTPLHERE